MNLGRSPSKLTLGIDIDCLLSGDGMGPDDGMFIQYGLPSKDASAVDRGLSLLDGGVDSLESMKPLLEQWAQSIISLDGIGEESVATCGGQIKDVEKSRTGWLLFI
jgi:hypothetical protein